MAREGLALTLRYVWVLFGSFLLSACNIMPGMQNLDTSRMTVQHENVRAHVKPVLVPITPTLIADQHISKYVYHVAPADILNIRVWQHPEFSPLERSIGTNTPSTQGAAGQAGYLVSPAGNIYFPLIGYVRVAGHTADEIRVKISRRLRKYIKNPQVNVRIADFRGQKVYVLGEIKKPGFVPLNDQPLSITDALSMSGSIDPDAADPGHIYVIRGQFIRPKIYWLDAKQPDAMLLAEHFTLQPNDVLYISSSTATRWNRVLNQLLPTLQTIWYTKTITNT